MGSGGGTSTQTTVQELSPEQRALIEPVIPIARSFVQNPPKLFPGSGIVGFNPLQQQAQQMTVQAAQQMMPGLSNLPAELNSVQQGWNSTINAAGQQGAAGQGQLQQMLAALAGSTANINPSLQPQQQNITNAAAGNASNIQNMINQGNSNISGGLNFLTSGDVLNPSSNPHLQAAIEAATRPTIENFQQQILPGLASEAITAGGYGGSRQGIAEGLAAGAATRQIGDMAANMSNANYQAGLQAMLGGLNTAVGQQGQNLQAMLGSGQLTNQAANQVLQSMLNASQLEQQGLGALIQGNLGGQQASQNWLQQQQAGLQNQQNLLANKGNILQQGLLPSRLLEGVGMQQQMMEQALLSEQVQRYVNEQMMPFLMAQDVAALAFGMPGGTTKTTATGGGNSMAGIQTGIGAISALAPLLMKSDRRLKRDIVKVGELIDGLGIYIFKFIGESVERFGLMADEVVKLYPKAVVDNGEYLSVDYTRIPTWMAIGKGK